MINAVHASTTCHDDFEPMVSELAGSGSRSQEAHLPTYDTARRWPSSLHMFNQAYKACKSFQVSAQRTHDTSRQYIYEILWPYIKEVTDFLTVATATTEAQAGSTYCTMSYICRAVFLLNAKCKAEITVQSSSARMSRKSQHYTFHTIAFEMMWKLESYIKLISGSASSLARVPNPENCH